MSQVRLLLLAVMSLLLLMNSTRNKQETFETKKDYKETEMRTLIEQALSNKIFLWGSTSSNCMTTSTVEIINHCRLEPKFKNGKRCFYTAASDCLHV